MVTIYQTAGQQLDDCLELEPITTWIGVTADTVINRVTVLDLHNKGLVGSVPNPNSTALVSLSFIQNQLTGVVPDFDKLSALESIDLTDNNISGSLPDFTHLAAVRTIIIGYNTLTGSLVDFSNCPLLTTLSVSHNQLSGAVPDFKNLPVLENLYFSFNPLTGTIPNFSDLPILEVILISFREAFPPLMPFLNCYLISCNSNQLTGIAPTYTNCPHLNRVYLEYTIPSFNNPASTTFRFCVRGNPFTSEDILPNYYLLLQMCAPPQLYMYSPQQLAGTPQQTAVVAGTTARFWRTSLAPFHGYSFCWFVLAVLE